MRLFIFALIAGIAMISIGVSTIVMNLDELAFVRGMMLIITGMIITGFAYKLKKAKVIT